MMTCFVGRGMGNVLRSWKEIFSRWRFGVSIFSLEEVIFDDVMIPQLKLTYPETTYLFTSFGDINMKMYG